MTDGHTPVRFLWQVDWTGESAGNEPGTNYQDRADRVSLYWFTGQGDWRDERVVTAGLQTCLPQRSLALPATDEEVAAWDAAARDLVEAIHGAVDRLSTAHLRTMRWRQLPLLGLIPAARFAAARNEYLAAVAAATAAYGPVFQIVDERLAAHESAVAADAARQFEAQERRRSEALAEYEAWQLRLASTRLERPEPARNRAVRAEAVHAMTAVAHATTGALRRAGHPGILTISDKPSASREGWRLTFDWSGLPGGKAVRTPPPDVPLGHLSQGEWSYVSVPPSTSHAVLWTPSPGRFEISTVTTRNMGGYATIADWWDHSIDEFLEQLVTPVASFFVRYGSNDRTPRVDLADYLDPAVYEPYVRAVAGRAMVAFRELIPPGPSC